MAKKGPSKPVDGDEAVPPTPVHPLARSLAGLLSPMSFRDQQFSFTWAQRLMYATGIALYPVAWYMETFQVFAYGVLAAFGVCCVLFVPNWYQNADPQVKFVDRAVTKAYYAELAEAQAAASQ
jgi:hypothetical protein